MSPYRPGPTLLPSIFLSPAARPRYTHVTSAFTVGLVSAAASAGAELTDVWTGREPADTLCSLHLRSSIRCLHGSVLPKGAKGTGEQEEDRAHHDWDWVLLCLDFDGQP